MLGQVVLILMRAIQLEMVTQLALCTLEVGPGVSNARGE